MTSYPTPEFRRTALAPGILAAIVLVAGAALLGSSEFIWIRFAVSILALVVSVYAWQSRQWWWLTGLLPIAVIWNPVLPLAVAGPAWQAAQFVAAILFIVAGILIKVRNPEDRNREGRNRRRR